MKKTITLLAGTSALFAAALGLQAQTSSSPSASQTPATSSQPNNQAGSSTMQSTSPSSSANANSSVQAPSSSGITAQPNGSGAANSATMNSSDSANASASANGSVNSSSQANSAYPSVTYPNTSTNANSAQANSRNQSGTQSNTNTTVQAGAQNSYTTTTQNETQVTTFVQQLDAQGPAVVQRISTQVGDLACSQDTIQNLVEALHSGQSVTISANVDGQMRSSTFNPSGAHLGYGEAYLAISLGAQELRNAGVTSCATPDQWQAVLLGGPINTSITSSSTNSYASASGSTQFPGIVTLHTQGQGWGQIAQTTHLQLDQVVNNDVSSNSSNINTSSTNTNSAPSATGYSSAQTNHGYLNAPADNDSSKNGAKQHWWNRGKNTDDDKKANEEQNSSSTHADTSANESATNGASTTTPSTH